MIGVRIYGVGEEAEKLLCTYGITPFGPAVDGKGFMFDVAHVEGDYLLDKIRL